MAAARRAISKFCLMALGALLAMPAAQAQQEEAERRLSRVTVTRPSPFVGSLHVKLVVEPPAGAVLPEASRVELLFVPVVLDDEEGFIPAITAEDGKHLIRAERDTGPVSDPNRLLPTEKMVMAPGEYLLSEVRFAGAEDEGPARSFCLSAGTFRFVVRAQETLFLGRLVLKAPETVAAGTTGSDVFSAETPLEHLAGWRRTKDALRRLKTRPAQFQPSDIFCPHAAGGAPAL